MLYTEVMDTEYCAITGLPHGPALRLALDELVAGTATGTWLMFIRIDRIEYINSHYGRETGDETLHRVAQILLRTADSGNLHRGAGPLFVLLFTGDSPAALATAERIRKSVAESAELIEPLSVSIALVAGDEADSAETLEDIAESRLQIARRRGGNTVCAVSYADNDSDFSSGVILVVDPDVTALGVLIREIEAKGFTVMTATDGLEALQLISQFAPDVVISELTVPKLSGFELRVRLRQSEELAVIPFVLLSHRWTDALIRQASSLRILHYYQKPVSAVMVAELVKNLAGPRLVDHETGCV